MLFRLAASLSCLLLGAPTYAADRYHNEEHHFALDLGSEWSLMGPELVRALNTMEKAAGGPQLCKAITGFYRTGSPPLEPPYIIVFVNPALSAKRFSFDQFKKEMTLGVADLPNHLKGAVNVLINDVKPGEIAFDRERHRAVFRMTTKLGVFGSMEMVTYMNPGREEAIQISGYFSPEGEANHLPLIRSLADSFRWDDGHEFKDLRGLRAMIAGANSGLVGGIVGGVVAVIVVMIWKKRLSSRARSGANRLQGVE